ncbi:histidine kinase dimerization/phospho-acceptor domain-containing protein [Methylibium sp.]|uniref:histidine kinase dimerization/phospho-acceptor domain-containing protein n=1 Tax=Methylibium sp. TaxID=2067992 RepID=UPI00345C5190
MRTPLNAVIGFTQLLRLHGGHDEQRLSQYSEHILQAGQHLLHWSTTFSTFSRSRKAG